MITLRNVLLTLFTVVITTALSAQDDGDTRYYMFDYMKVKPGMDDEYLACEKAWKKIHAYKKEKGMIGGWGIAQVMSPNGTTRSHDYVTRQWYKDRKSLAQAQDGPFMPENWESLLTKEEIDLVNRTEEFRDLLYSEIVVQEERVLSDDIEGSNIAVINFFKIPKGSSVAEHMKVEREMWLPFHKKNIKEGKLQGWIMMQRLLPIGSDYHYDVITVDIYKSMAQFWEPLNWDEFFALNPGKNIEQLTKIMNEVGMINRAEIHYTIDGLSN